VLKLHKSDVHTMVVVATRMSVKSGLSHEGDRSSIPVEVVHLGVLHSFHLIIRHICKSNVRAICT
jgi:hypothetical protein